MEWVHKQLLKIKLYAMIIDWTKVCVLPGFSPLPLYTVATFFFTEIGKEMGVNPETVWYIYFKKGLMAIENYCKTNKTHSDENIDDRILDAVNYLIILYGITKQK